MCNVIADITGIFLYSVAFYRSSPIFIHNHPCNAATAFLSESALLRFCLPNCPQDFTDLTASSASFIPTVTAISTSPDLQWMVQPLISSVAPSHRAPPYSPSPSYKRAVMRSAASKAHGKRGRVEQVIRNHLFSYSSKTDNNMYFMSIVMKPKLFVVITQTTPEEEEKKRIRRERNKQAAAKCRNRRRELTDTLQAVSITQILLSSILI